MSMIMSTMRKNKKPSLQNTTKKRLKLEEQAMVDDRTNAESMSKHYET